MGAGLSTREASEKEIHYYVCHHRIVHARTGRENDHHQFVVVVVVSSHDDDASLVRCSAASRGVVSSSTGNVVATKPTTSTTTTTSDVARALDDENNNKKSSSSVLGAAATAAVFFQAQAGVSGARVCRGECRPFCAGSIWALSWSLPDCWCLATEKAVLKPNMSGDELMKLVIADSVYGLAGVLVLYTGYLRVTQYGKGWEFYSH